VAGKLPPAVNLLTKSHVATGSALLEAALKKDEELAFWAFKQDPLTAKLSLNDAKTLFDEMFDNTKAYLKF
jgi:alpha-galactosidase